MTRVCFLLGFCSVLFAIGCSGSTTFQGIVLDPAEPAPDFQLRDQFGDVLALSDLAGNVVVLTFLYTHCPDICPVTVETLRQADQILGDAAGVEIVAVTVDPERDTADRVREYSEERGMLDRWRFLIGERDQVSAVWRSYWLDPARPRASAVEQPHQDTAEPNGYGNSTVDERHLSGDYLVDHTAPVFLIDRKGFRKVVFTRLPLDPGPLVHDIRLLLK